MSITTESIATVIAEETAKSVASWAMRRLIEWLMGLLMPVFKVFLTYEKATDMSKEQEKVPRKWGLDGETGGEGADPPPVEVTRAGDRKQIYLPRELMEMLEKYAEASGQKVVTLTAEAVAIFLKLMADQNRRGDLLPSQTAHRLRRLGVDLAVHPGDIVRASVAIGCRLLEEQSKKKDEDRVLFDDLVDEAKAQGRTVPGLVAQYIKAGLAKGSK